MMDFDEPSREGDRTRVSQVSRIADKHVLGNRVACLVQIYGRDIGRKYELSDGEVTIGRGPDSSIVVDMDNVSRSHCVIIRGDFGYSVLDLGSTNGTFLNDRELRKQQVLRNDDLLKVGGVIFKFIGGDNIEQLYYEEIYRMAIIDGLTQAYNKRYLIEFLDRELARCKRYTRPLSVALFDLDFFKKVNDEFGHLAGDYALKQVSDLIREHVMRKEECFARYGGEEFAVVLPDTSLTRALQTAEKIRALIDQEPFEFEGTEIPVTISIGVSEMEKSDTPETFIARADARLYEAKRAGRNCVMPKT